MGQGFATIGHSDRSNDEFIAMLREDGVEMLVDVRAFPRSRTNPAFNIDVLPDALEKVQIGYCHCPALGGRRPHEPGVDPDRNAWWRVKSFHNYADHALGPEFGAALARLIELGRGRRVAMMCAEAVWWRCHRRIITDYLLLNGHKVTHLMAPGRRDEATPSPGARPTGDGRVVYPATP